MKYPDLKVKFQSKTLDLQYLGKFEVEKDERGKPIICREENQDEISYLLSIQTELTNSGEPELITRLPNHLRTKLNRKYYDTRNLRNVWRLPGIYAFVSMKGNNIEYKYIGRASGTIADRLRQYLAPSFKRMTTFYVNRLLFKTLEKGSIVLIYFYPEPDIEKELQILLCPDWNREVPRDKIQNLARSLEK